MLACGICDGVRIIWVANEYHAAVNIFWQVQAGMWVARFLCLLEWCLLDDLMLVLIVYGIVIGPLMNLITLLLPYLLCNKGENVGLFTGLGAE